MRASAFKFSQKVLGEGGLRLISTLFILFLARRLGAEDFGRYASAFAFASLCIVFVDLGTNAILTREIARHPQERSRIASASHWLKMVASAGSWGILWGATYVLRFTPPQRFVALGLGVVVIGQTLTEYFSALLSGMEEMGWEAVLKVVSRALGLMLGFYALVMHKPLNIIVLNMAVGSVIGYTASVLILRYRLDDFGMLYDPQRLKELLQASLPLFGCVFFWILYDSQDIILLNYFHFSQREIGRFAAAMKVIDVLRVYPVLMMGVFFPTFARLHGSDAQAFRAKQRRLLFFTAGSLTFLAAFVYAAAPWIIQILYKSDFAPASTLLRLLLPALVLMGLTHVQMQLLVALNQERKLFLGALGACVSNVIFAVLFLPRWGVPGACYALCGSEFIYLLFLRKMSAALS